MRILITDDNRHFETQLEIVKSRCEGLHTFLTDRLENIDPGYHHPMRLKQKDQVVGTVRVFPAELEYLAAAVIYAYSHKTDKTSVESLNFDFELNPKIWDSDDFKMFLQEVGYQGLLDYLDGKPDESFYNNQMKLYEDDRYKDAYIVAEAENVEFPVHTEFLVSRCPALGNALLDPAFEEYRTGKVHVPGSAKAVEYLVYYIYLDEGMKKEEPFQGYEVELIGLAHMYNLHHLAALYEEQLINNKHLINEEDVDGIVEVFKNMNVRHVLEEFDVKVD